MEVYEAKHSYKQVADSVLTFNAGDTFYILGRPSEKWWFAKRIVDNTFGYVPVVYLQPAKQKVIGKLVPENRRNSREYDIHLKALAEIHKKVTPLPVLTRSQSCPAHVIKHALAMETKPKQSSTKTTQKASSVLASRKMISMDNEGDLPEHLQNFPSPPLSSPPPPDYDLSDSAFTYTNGKPYHHQMNISGHPEGDRIPISEENEDEVHLIKPKPLVNPVIQSKERMDLHRELKQSGRKVLDQPELKKVFRDRKITEKKKEADKFNDSRRTSMEIKLLERQEMLEKEEKKEKLAKEGIVEDEDEALKPEFAKVKLRHTNASKT